MFENQRASFVKMGSWNPSQTLDLNYTDMGRPLLFICRCFRSRDEPLIFSKAGEAGLIRGTRGLLKKGKGKTVDNLLHMDMQLITSLWQRHPFHEYSSEWRTVRERLAVLLTTVQYINWKEILNSPGISHFPRSWRAPPWRRGRDVRSYLLGREARMVDACDIDDQAPGGQGMMHFGSHPSGDALLKSRLVEGVEGVE